MERADAETRAADEPRLPSELELRAPAVDEREEADVPPLRVDDDRGPPLERFDVDEELRDVEVLPEPVAPERDEAFRLEDDPLPPERLLGADRPLLDERRLVDDPPLLPLLEPEVPARVVPERDDADFDGEAARVDELRLLLPLPLEAALRLDVLPPALRLPVLRLLPEVRRVVVLPPALLVLPPLRDDPRPLRLPLLRLALLRIEAAGCEPLCSSAPASSR